MADKETIARLQALIARLHGCESTHADTFHVHEVAPGKTLWKGDVEVFDLIGHPTAKRCYVHSYGQPEKYITILELPPVTDFFSALEQIKKARGQ